MKIGFTCSTFDLLHAGHVLMLKECRDHCDILLVGLQSDPTLDRPDSKNRPVQGMYERWTQLKGCKYVNEVVPYSTEEDLLNLLKTRNFDVRFVGADYIDKDFTGKQWCIDNGKEIIYNSRKHGYSTTSLRKRMAI